MMDENDFVARIEAAGGTVYIVGGWVRDRLLGRPAKDKDYVICHLSERDFCRLFPQAQCVGKHFPVYLLVINGEKCEVAFARSEKKQGKGYTGFQCIADPSISIEMDLQRRDTRINSIAYRLPEGTLIDPLQGQCDLAHRLIRASSTHFGEDPVRALRASRQAAELSFTIDAATLAAMTACRAELALEPHERIFNELNRALAAEAPVLFFANLLKAQLLTTIFPELAAATQKKAAFAALASCTAAALPLAIRFAALCCTMSATALTHWRSRACLPKNYYKAALTIIEMRDLASSDGDLDKAVACLLTLKKAALPLEVIQQILPHCLAQVPAYLQKAAFLLDCFQAVDPALCPQKGNGVGLWLQAQYRQILQDQL